MARADSRRLVTEQFGRAKSLPTVGRTLRDLGVTIISPRSVSQTDHISFDALACPHSSSCRNGWNTISRTHHSNMEPVDHVQRDDMVQMATVVAVFAYDEAMRNEKLPAQSVARAPPSTAQSIICWCGEHLVGIPRKTHASQGCSPHLLEEMVFR